MKKDIALQQTIRFISVFVIIFTVIICQDLMKSMDKSNQFISELDQNAELVELIGRGYEVKAVETSGNYINPTIEAYVSHVGFDFLVEFDYKKVSTVDLIVQCKMNKKTEKKTCYHQQLYPKAGELNTY